MSSSSEASLRVADNWTTITLLMVMLPGVISAQSTVRSFDPGANGPVHSIAVQPDGKILVGGVFTTLGGGGKGITTRHNIGRLNANGALDRTFNPGANGEVHSIAVQPDGKILVGGFFDKLGGGTGTTTRNHIGRLNADGTLDVSFNPGANTEVYAIAVQADGKILVGGVFTTLGGGGTGTTTRHHIGRLNGDGTLDTSFDPDASCCVHTITVQADGKILVGGNFTTLSGGTGTTRRNFFGRLNPNGTLDTSFDPGANEEVFAIAVQADGKILIGGNFTTLRGGTGTTRRNFIARLNPDGTPDANFDPGANSAVQAVAVQADGEILVGGDFTKLGHGAGTTTHYFIGRFNADGSLDGSFNPGADKPVDAIAVQADRQILVGGYFSKLGGGGWPTTTRNYITRLNADGTLDMGRQRRRSNLPSSQQRSGQRQRVRQHASEFQKAGPTPNPRESAGDSGPVESVTFSPDGKTLASGRFVMLNCF